MRSSKTISVSIAALACGLPVIFLWCYLHFGRMAFAAEQEKTGEPMRLVECTVTIGVRDPAGTLQLVIKDEKLLNRLIGEPFRNARPNPNPASYVLAGSVDCKYSNGSESLYGLFLPWGYCEVDSKYLIADLHELKKELRERIKMAKSTIDRLEDESKKTESEAGKR